MSPHPYELAPEGLAPEDLAPAPPEPRPAAEPTRDGRPAFRLLIAPGVVPASWVRTWRERVTDVALELVPTTDADAGPALAGGRADAALLRLPVDRDAVSAIPLYVETTVVVLPKDHVLTTLDEVTPADLADETLLVPADDVLRWTDPPGERSALPAPATTEEAVALVASGVGLLAVPQSLARLHHRRDLTYRTLVDAPTAQAALAWPLASDGDPLVEEMIGIVRGRTANSSRGRGTAAPETPKAPERTPNKGPATSGGRGPAAARGRGGRPSFGSGGGRGRSRGGRGR